MFESGPISYGEQMAALASALNLPYFDDQDWGITYADSERLAEFLDFAEREFSSAWNPWVAAELVDLLLQSATESAVNAPPEDLERLRRWLMAESVSVRERLAYWLDLEPSDWFIVAKLHAWGFSSSRPPRDTEDS